MSDKNHFEIQQAKRAAAKAPWQPMRLTTVGSVGQLMRDTSSGSRRDGTGSCQATARRRDGGTGIPC